MKTTIAAALAVWMTVLAGNVAAHHGAFEYDRSKTIRIQGQVTAFHWRNPHTSIELVTKNGSGQAVGFEIEAGGPSALVPLGVSIHSVVPGEHVIAVVYPHRSSPTHGLGIELIRADGQVVPLGSGAIPAGLDAPTGVAKTLSGTWVPRRGAFFALIAAHGSWPLTGAGRTVFDHYDVTQSPAAHCVPLSAPTIMLYRTVHTLTVSPDRVTMDADWLGATRTIYLDGRGHPGPEQRFRQGHSIGHWQGDVLAVDTSNFAAEPSGLTFGIPSSEGKHLTERFRLAADGATLQIDYVLEDPEYLSEPVRGHYEWAYRPDLKPSGVPCDLETAAQYLKVAGPRR